MGWTGEKIMEKLGAGWVWFIDERVGLGVHISSA